MSKQAECGMPLPRSAPHYLVLPERRSVAAALAQCHLLDAQMAVPASDVDNKQLQRAMQPYLASCSATPWKLWLGVSDTQQEGVWTSFATGTEAPYNNFVLPFPYGGSMDNCAALFSDGTWGDARCSLKKCSGCDINPANFLRLRGLCFEDEHNSRFRASGHVDGRPLFRGFYDLLIAWNKTDSRWLLKTIGNITLATMAPSSLEEYPLGLHIWSVESLLCGAHPGETLQLSLSPCSTSSHFMCRSGQCVAHTHRCNMKYECDDGSDEDDCNMINLQRGYRSHLTPPGRGGFNRAGVIGGGGADDTLDTIVKKFGPRGDKSNTPDNEGGGRARENSEGLPLTLTPFMTVTRITEIDDTDMAVTVELHITLTWTDDRLAFSHLAGLGQGAVLSMEDVSKIWVPQYGLQEVKGRRDEVLQQSVRINTANNPTPPSFNTIKMDLVYPGSHNALSLTTYHLATFTCPHHPYTYPFTTHRCSFKIALPSTYKDLVRLEPLKEATFSGPKDVGQYSVIQVSPGQASEGQVSVEIELQHHGVSLVLSLFLPTLLLLGISWFSFFVVWEELLVRVVLSIGTLMLLYILRLVPLAPSIPSTPSVTLIDIWNFFALVVLSINTAVHILVPQPPSTEQNLKLKPLFVAPAGNSGVVIRRKSEDARPCSPRIVLAYRTFILPAAVIAFNITFWLLMLSEQPW